MNICPKCSSQYTDATLKFCLQDGAALIESGEPKTEIIDTDAFSQEETVAVNNPAGTKPVGRPRNTAHDAARIDYSDSRETIIRPPAAVKSKSGFSGILLGCLAASLLVGLIGVVGLGVWLLPGFLADRTVLNTNTNTNTNTSEKKVVPVSFDDILTVRSSSIRKADSGNLYLPQNVIDSDDLTAWCEGVKGPGKGEWLRIEFDKSVNLSEMTMKPGYFKSTALWKKNNRVASIELLFSGGESRKFDFPDEMRSQKIPLTVGKTKFVKIYIRDVFRGSADSEDTLISEISFGAIASKN